MEFPRDLGNFSCFGRKSFTSSLNLVRCFTKPEADLDSQTCRNLIFSTSNLLKLAESCKFTWHLVSTTRSSQPHLNFWLSNAHIFILETEFFEFKDDQAKMSNKDDQRWPKMTSKYVFNGAYPFFTCCKAVLNDSIALVAVQYVILRQTVHDMSCKIN